MSDIGLFEFGEPPLLVVDANAGLRLVSALPPAGSIAVVRLDGAKMLEVHDVFEQFSGALRFPAYFGWNWDALSDCLRDLSWWPADCYLIIVDRAEEMLKGSPEERAVLFAVLSRAVRDWANPLGKTGGKGILFRVLLLATEDAMERIRAEIVRR